MTEQLAEGIFHNPHTVLGRRLRPFTFWHEWMLDFCGSPYVGASQDFDARGILLAIEILSRRPSAPGRHVTLPRVRGGMCRRLLRAGFANVHRQLQAYFRDHATIPFTWENDDGKPVKSQRSVYCVASLMRHGKLSHDAAWATGVGYGRHLVLALAEAGGHEIPLISDAEAEAVREAGWTL